MKALSQCSLVVMLVASGALAIEPVFDMPHRGCYYTNWAQYRQGVASYKPANVDPALCTYISIAFGSIVNNVLTPLEWNDLDTFAALTALKQTAPNLKIFLSVGGWTLTSQLVTVAATASSRTAFINSAISNLRTWGLDGLDIDWEFPLAADKSAYSTFLKEIRAAFQAEAASSGKTRLALSAAVHLISDGGFDGVVINNTLDVVNVMTYDLAGAWDLSGTGHQASLFVGPRGVPSEWNVASIMQTWVDAGVAKSKLAVGLPLYGRGWMLASASSHGLGAPVSAALTASFYTTESGAWPYYEICKRIQSDGATKVFDTTIQASYAYTGSWWIGYDDVQTIAGKTTWAKNNGYGGVYVWDTAQDDFANLCGQGKNPLLNAIKTASLGGSNPGTVAATPPRTTTTTVATTSKATTTTTKAPSTTVKATTAAATIKTVPPTVQSGPLTTAKPAVTTTTTATTGAPPRPTTAASSGTTATCGTPLCTQKGPGLVALGACSTTFCNCDQSNVGYLTSCGGALIFDSVNHYCNYQSQVAGCAG
ncbi:Acidic mammalian chitinase [Hypsibius exemplaris]|uniref:Acidic mammalian chitinase n=1 Tax=Hypsibius exemplaris TaxID=2072580 RepID=A0A9X6NMY8_HYPEX|nr:Acidic mammalian chitinase [Hypsibius exemplaris]